MSTRREGIGSPDSNIYPRPLRPSGLRTRERTPQNRPHADRPRLPPASAASSSLAPNSASPTTPTIVPLFESPVAADRANRRRGWVGGSSSRRLKFPKLREKTSVSKEDKKMATSPGLHPQGKSPRQFIVSDRTFASSAFPLTAESDSVTVPRSRCRGQIPGPGPQSYLPF